MPLRRIRSLPHRVPQTPCKKRTPNMRHEGSAAVCLAVRRNLRRRSVYGCFHKHPKADALVEAPQKATTAPEFFDTDDSLDPSSHKMKKSCQIAVLALAALVAANPFNCPPAATVTVTYGDGHSTPASNSVPVTSAPPPVSTMVTAGSADYMTISITNVYGTQLSLSFASNAGGPTPVGNPSATVLPDTSPTQYAFPTGWAGRIYVGPNTNPMGSKIEGSITGPPDIDVSYVDGYSVPITCSSEGTAVSGCNIDLFKQPSITCNNQVDGPVCLNSAQNIPNGPAPPFFTACAGAAYTYPNDNEANVSNLKSNLVSCCIGTSCKAPSRQHPKRGNPTPESTIQIRSGEPWTEQTRGSPPSTLPFAHKFGHHHHSPRSRVHGAVH